MISVQFYLVIPYFFSPFYVVVLCIYLVASYGFGMMFRPVLYLIQALKSFVRDFHLTPPDLVLIFFQLKKKAINLSSHPKSSFCGREWHHEKLIWFLLYVLQNFLPPQFLQRKFLLGFEFYSRIDKVRQDKNSVKTEVVKHNEWLIYYSNPGWGRCSGWSKRKKYLKILGKRPKSSIFTLL